MYRSSHSENFAEYVVQNSMSLNYAFCIVQCSLYSALYVVFTVLTVHCALHCTVHCEVCNAGKREGPSSVKAGKFMDKYWLQVGRE